MFDIKSFLLTTAQVAPFTLPIVMALVTAWGRLGVKGNWQLLSSLATGLVIGGATMYFVHPPDIASEWFAIVMFGLIMGLTASGVYQVGKEMVKKT